MSKKLFCFCLSALAISGLLLVSCSEDTETVTVYAPTISVSAATVTAPAAGGTYSITYTISNPADDGSLSCSASASWISGVTDTGSGVSFSVAENTTGSARTGQVVLSYSSSYGSASKTVVVAQNANDVPELTVQPTAVAAAIEGGTYSFTYSIVNPASDGEISCSASVSWISSFNYASAGTVSFSVAANEASTVREGVITVLYTYGAGELQETVTVVQDHEAGSGDGGDGGGGGGGGDLSDFVGTYACAGQVYGSSGPTDDTWTMKIYTSSTNTLILSGLVPDVEQYFPYGDGNEDGGPYTASATVSGNNILVAYPQWTGYRTTSSGVYVYICWAKYSKYEGGWYYSSESGTCTFSYNSSTGTWTSDTGLFLANSTSANDVSTFNAFYDLFTPGMSFTKTSSTTGTNSMSFDLAHPIDENLILHTDFYPAK